MNPAASFPNHLRAPRAQSSRARSCKRLTACCRLRCRSREASPSRTPRSVSASASAPSATACAALAMALAACPASPSPRRASQYAPNSRRSACFGVSRTSLRLVFPFLAPSVSVVGGSPLACSCMSVVNLFTTFREESKYPRESIRRAASSKRLITESFASGTIALQPPGASGSLRMSVTASIRFAGTPQASSALAMATLLAITWSSSNASAERAPENIAVPSASGLVSLERFLLTFDRKISSFRSRNARNFDSMQKIFHY